MISLTARLLKLDTPTVSDALDTLGLPGAVFGIQPMTVRRRIVGPALTVKVAAPMAHLPKRHLGAHAIMAAQGGEVIVVEHRGRTDVSAWGGLLSRAAIAAGISGIVVDGAFRDIDEAAELDFPIFGRAAVPITARGRIAEHASNEPVTIAGVAVAPGDYVMADGSGVVFIPIGRAEEVVGIAEDIFRREQLMVRDIEAGKPLGDILGANYEDMLKRDKEAE